VSYVLVSLLGDDATEAIDAFARWFAGSHPPARAFHSEHPDHDAGARVWVYACMTRAENLEDDLESFGRRVHDGGVALFAGHARAISAAPPFLSFPEPRAKIYQALARAFRAFLQGENDAAALRRAALKGAVSGRSTVLVAPWIERDMESLRVLRRGPVA
jgi:hypothetical protein